MENEMLSISEAARLMGVHENTLRDWDIENKFKASRTVGGHRRYSLSDIRNYLDRMPAEALKEVGIIEEPKEKDPFKAIIQKWEEAGYLNELDNFTQKSILAAMLENCKTYRDRSAENTEFHFSTNQILWLTQQGWVRSRFRKLVGVQPMWSPTALIYYIHNVDDPEHMKIISEPVAAKTFTYSFVAFPGADFDKLKDVYANAIATEIDNILFSALWEKHSCDVEPLLDIAKLPLLPRGSLSMYEYIIAPVSIIQELKKYPITSKLELFEYRTLIDEKTFKPMAVAGKRPVSYLYTPIFCPYVLLAEQPISSGFIAFKSRFGMLK
jgi:excisionase family DNA binding protein